MAKVQGAKRQRDLAAAREYLREVGRRGGIVRSAAKREAAKAREAKRREERERAALAKLHSQEVADPGGDSGGPAGAPPKRRRRTTQGPSVRANPSKGQ